MLLDLVKQNPSMDIQWRLTGDQNASLSKEERQHTSFGRVTDLAFLKSLNFDKDSIFFLCGPPTMVLNLIEKLESLGISKSNINYEKWIDNVFY